MVLVRKLRDRLATTAPGAADGPPRVGTLSAPPLRGRIQRFLDEGTGRADRLPMGAVYEATMRCNLHCEFCYVGDLLNIEGEWRQELPLDALAQAFPAQDGFQVSLTGGEIFMRKDIMSVLDLFREKGYACGYLTTNGTIITEERAEALAELARDGFPQAHQRLDRRPGRAARCGARPERHVRAHDARACGGCRRRRGAKARRSASASTRPSRTRASTRSTRWSTSPRSSASTRSASTT